MGSGCLRVQEPWLPLPSSYLSCPQVLSLRDGRRQWVLTVMCLEAEKTNLRAFTQRLLYAALG